MISQVLFPTLHGLEVFPESWVLKNTPARLHPYASVRSKTAFSLFPASYPFLESKKRAAAQSRWAGQLRKLMWCIGV